MKAGGTFSGGEQLFCFLNVSFEPFVVTSEQGSTRAAQKSNACSLRSLAWARNRSDCRIGPHSELASELLAPIFGLNENASQDML